MSSTPNVITGKKKTPKNIHSYNFKILDSSVTIFTNLAPLGRVGLGVTMSVCVSVCLCVCAIKSQGSKGGPRGAKQSPIGPQIT